jgi:hypothetical protein
MLVKYFVEAGRLGGSGGGLSKLNAAEAISVARQLQEHGVSDIHIVEAKHGAPVTEADLERIAQSKYGHDRKKAAPASIAVSSGHVHSKLAHGAAPVALNWQFTTVFHEL